MVLSASLSNQTRTLQIFDAKHNIPFARHWKKHKNSCEWPLTQNLVKQSSESRKLHRDEFTQASWTPEARRIKQFKLVEIRARIDLFALARTNRAVRAFLSSCGARIEKENHVPRKDDVSFRIHLPLEEEKKFLCLDLRDIQRLSQIIV